MCAWVCVHVWLPSHQDRTMTGVNRNDRCLTRVLCLWHSYETEPSGYRQTQNVTNKLMFVPRIEDDNTTLYCIATKTGRRQLVAVLLSVTPVPHVLSNGPGETEISNVAYVFG